MNWFDPDFVWPVLGSVVAGALIGLEREYRGAPAGFRTHILVSLASSLLMLAAVHQIRWLSDTPSEIIRIDPVRMAHGILTGIGFLGAGVIFREGMTIRGLTTAASLWITSAIGTLYGVGFYGLAVGGTVATLLVLAAVTVTETRLPQRSYVDITIRYRRGSALGEAWFRDTLKAHGAHASKVAVSADQEVTSFETTVQTHRALNTDALAAALSDDAEVVGFTIRPHAT